MKSQSQFYSRYFTYIKPLGKLPFVKTYGSTIFTLFIVTIFIFFAIKPTVETILILQKKVSDTSLVLEKVNKKATDLSKGKQNYDNLQNEIKSKITQYIPDSVVLKSITNSLEQSAKVHDASVSALQIQPLVIETKDDQKVGSLTEVNFTFNIEGEYKNLIASLQDLSTSSRLIKVNSLSISKVSESSNLIMSIIGKAYYIK